MRLYKCDTKRTKYHAPSVSIFIHRFLLTQTTLPLLPTLPPRFVVTGLDNESEFQLIVYAGNSKGRSSITRLVAITQKLPVKQLETRLSNSGNDGNYYG